jgi:hypothetical protein
MTSDGKGREKKGKRDNSPRESEKSEQRPPPAQTPSTHSVVLIASSISDIRNPLRRNLELPIRLRHARAVNDLGNTLRSPPLAHRDASRRGVRHDVTTDGLLLVGGTTGGVVDGGDDLVGNDDGDTELREKRGSVKSDGEGREMDGPRRRDA